VQPVPAAPQSPLTGRHLAARPAAELARAVVTTFAVAVVVAVAVATFLGRSLESLQV